MMAKITVSRRQPKPCEAPKPVEIEKVVEQPKAKKVDKKCEK